MSWTIKIRGAHSQPIALDLLCPNCGPQSTIGDRDCDGLPCVDGCGAIAERVLSASFIGPEKFTVVRGGVAKAERPEWLSTRGLAEGQTMQEYRAQRDRVQEEKRHREAKDFERFAKGVV
jgi:hypothetical protein